MFPFSDGKRIDGDDGPVLLVRTVPREGPGSTKIVDETSGMLIAEDRLELIPGMGFVGVRTSYQDFRDVAGVRLPFRIVSTYATPLIGEVVMEFDEVDHGEAARRHLVGEDG